MSDLGTWLLEQIAEDERIATAAAGAPWSVKFREIVAGDRYDKPSMLIYDEGGHTDGDAAHIVAWQPTRVLVECQAKRMLVERVDAGRWEGYAYRDAILPVLALPYADRPGYEEQWRP